MSDDASNGKPGGTILVVDDLASNLDLLQRLLSAQGYSVLTARDGEEALSVVAQSPPDVVLTDIRMPRRDGFGLCRELKSTTSTRLIPVVLMTGYAARLEQAVDKRLAVLPKPVAPHVLADAIARALASATPGVAKRG